MSRATDPVWLTGCGVVLSLGDDLAAFKEALFAARSAVPADTFDLPGTGAFKVPVARSMFDAASITAPSRLPLERGSAMALAAADAAFRMAGLGPGAFDAERTGLFWGSGMGGAASFEASCQALWGAQRRLRPTAVVTSMPNAALAEVALRLGIRGTAIGSACASAAVAIGEALRALQVGALDLAVVGGSEALLAPVVAGAWHAMRVLGPAQASAADRAGFALGEGEAAFVIETEAHARAQRRPGGRRYRPCEQPWHRHHCRRRSRGGILAARVRGRVTGRHCHQVDHRPPAGCRPTTPRWAWTWCAANRASWPAAPRDEQLLRLRRHERGADRLARTGLS